MRGVEATLIGEPTDMAVIAPDDRPGVQRHALAVHRSRKRIAPFRLHIPDERAEALSLLRERSRACVLAGGIDVINRMKSGDEPEDVVYIGRIDALRRIMQSQDGLHIGATCTHHELATSPIAARAAPALPSVWGSLANPRIRFKGTVGGNLMANEPDYEGPSILAAHGADLRFLTPAGVRMCRASSTSVLGGKTRRGKTRRGCSKPFSCRAIGDPSRLRPLSQRRRRRCACALLEGDVVVGARAAVTWAFPQPCCADLPIESADTARHAAGSRRHAGAGMGGGAAGTHDRPPCLRRLSPSHHRGSLASGARARRARHCGVIGPEPLAITFSLNGRDAHDQDRAIDGAGRCPARRPRPDRNEGRMRPGRMWCMHGPHRRPPDGVLHRVRLHG